MILVVEALTTIGNTNKGLNSSIACDGYDNYKIPPIAGKEFWDMIHLESAFTVEKDLNGKDINNFYDLETDMKYLYLTIFPQNGKTYVLLSCLRKHKRYLSPLMNQIQEKSVNERKIILSNILAIHVENLTISPSKWEKISEDKRSIFQKLFQDTVMVEGKSMTQLSNINLFV